MSYEFQYIPDFNSTYIPNRKFVKLILVQCIKITFKSINSGRKTLEDTQNQNSCPKHGMFLCLFAFGGSSQKGFEQVKFDGLVSNDALTETSSSGPEIARADSLFFTSLGSWVLA